MCAYSIGTRGLLTPYPSLRNLGGIGTNQQTPISTRDKMAGSILIPRLSNSDCSFRKFTKTRKKKKHTHTNNSADSNLELTVIYWCAYRYQGIRRLYCQGAVVLTSLLVQHGRPPHTEHQRGRAWPRRQRQNQSHTVTRDHVFHRFVGQAS